MPSGMGEVTDKEPTVSKRDKELAALKARRTVCEQQIVRAQEFVKRVADSKATSTSELSIRLSALEGAFKTFSSVQAKIEEKDVEEIYKPNRSEYEERYFLTAPAYKVLLQQLEGDCHITEETVQEDKYNAIRLPKIELHSFSGEVTDWMGWYDKFVSLVHENQHLNTLAKFHHLVSKLEGTAASAIDGLKIVKENYEVALQRLRERFENKKVICKKYIDLIFDHPKMAKACVNNLQELMDKMNNYLAGLKNLGRPVDQWDDLIVHLIVSKLDTDTAMKWREESSTDRLATLAELMSFLKKRCQILEEHVQIGSNDKLQINSSSKPRRQIKSFTATHQGCHICNKPGHFIYRCVTFLNMSTAQRLQRVKSLKLCENCMKTNTHNADSCNSKFKCHTCGNKHHSLLHQADDSATRSVNLSIQGPPSQHTAQQFLPSSSSTSNAAANIVMHSKAADGNILGTAIVELVNDLNQSIPCRALLDSGSQLNMVSDKIAKIAGLKRQYHPIQFAGANNTQSHSKYKTVVTIKSRYNQFAVTLEASIIPQITGLLPESNLDISNWNIPSNIKLSDPFFNIPQKIDLLIGVDVFYDIMSIGRIHLGPGLPIAQKSALGWIVAGRIPAEGSLLTKCHLALTINDEQSLDKAIQAFWQTENIECMQERISREDTECEKHFVNNFSRLPDGRYQVKLPFKSSPTGLGKSHEIALRRLYSLERKLQRNPQLNLQYNAFMQEFISLSHMERVTQINFDEPHYIIPHHCVLKPSSSTTKLRVVFDASSKSTTGKSLNELLMVGPVIQQDLFAIALRFRQYKYVFTADITKMYRQITLHPDDRQYHYVLWRSEENAPVSFYQLTTVTYGTASASFLATRALKQLTIDEEENFPHAANVARSDFNVDDLLIGGNNLADVISLQQQLKNMLIKGGFILRKWCANHEDILKDIPEENIEKACSINGKDAIKTLGMLWNPSTDKFLFHKTLVKNHATVTKRTVLSEISQFFDPVGLINPVIVLAKVFMQQLWRLKVHWDESLPQEYHCRWLSFQSQLHELNNFEMDRRVFADDAFYELHAFSDSSESAYGSCLYVRSVAHDGSAISVKLLCSKSRVAPLRKCSLPRLELCAAVIMIHLANRIVSIFNHVQFRNITYWTDSTVVLSWINEESCNWQTFIANRVALIHEFSTPSQWRHVPTEYNPADILSRGAFPSALLTSVMWYNGPNFLMKLQAHWPTSPTGIVSDDNLLERKKMKTVLNVHCKAFIESIKFHNDYNKLINVVAYMLRFIHNSRKMTRYNALNGHPNVEERHRALIAIIKIVQQSEFGNEINVLTRGQLLQRSSDILNLSPFVDDEGILRVGGRLRNAEIDYNSKHPILLPKGHVFTKCLLSYLHLSNHHVGPQSLLSIVRQSFWPIHGKIAARSVVRNCVRCCRASPVKNHQIMADMPDLRVQKNRPFSIIGIDFCGPFFVHFRRRGTSPAKAYVAVFICFVTKATHLELVEDLSTKAFLLSLKRFIGRRGRCSVIYSDNATNFIGARNELHELYRTLNDNKSEIERACTNDGITWKTIPPRSPHFGGLWEAAVKSFKYHFKRLLNNSSLSFPELNTLIIQIESILNSRPIVSVPENPNDPPALTPGHFIIGTALNTLPEPDIKHITNVNCLKRYQQLQWYFQQFWERWHTDYLQSLQVRTKWNSPGAAINVGDVVIVQEDNLPPLQWKFGRIMKVHPGKDGVIRVVTIKTASGEIQRATNRVRRLPL